MDWSNERYVRLFTRNTTTWRRLGWDGQNVLMHLLRVVDRAGVLDIQDMTPAEAVSLHTGAPAEEAERGIARMLDLAVVIHAGGRLIFPNFLTAQECPMSDKLRAKVSREKRALSHSDTAPSHNVTDESRDVTERHAESPTVTPSHAESQRVTLLPSRSDPTLPDPADPAAPGVTAAAESPNELLARAMRGRQRLSAVAHNLAGDIDHRGKWQHAFATLSEKPESEWAVAAKVLVAEAQRPGAARKLTPQHISDYWSTYAAGEAPGARNGHVRNHGTRAEIVTESDVVEHHAKPKPAWLVEPPPEDPR